jgi:phosphopantetheinyl transferase
MRLHAGALHIWHADLDAAGAEVEDLLDEQERERAARIVGEPARRRWKAARGMLRMLLGGYLGMGPGTLRFAREAHGKPMLDLPDMGRLHFNLSHSGALGVYALTDMCAVGVDVELTERDARTRSHSVDFLRGWVRREAHGKCVGTGVRNPTGVPPTESSDLWISELDLGPRAVAAVAMALEPVDFQVFTIDSGILGIYPASNTITTLDEPNVSEETRAGHLTIVGSAGQPIPI